LKFCLLALLYLFFARVLRAVWTEVGGRSSRSTTHPGGRTGSGRPAVGRLKVVEPPERKGQVIDVAEELTMGRAATCQLPLDDSYVSQLHARMFRRDGQLFVEDLGSTNGTYLNRKKVTGPVAVRRGDRLQVGKTVLEVSK
jgi:pSer/pThr/pTyr-binding forkhead associated (FHA) protein